MVFQQEIVLEKIEEILGSGVFIPFITNDREKVGIMMLAHFLVPIEKDLYKGIGIKLQAIIPITTPGLDPVRFLNEKREVLRKTLKQAFLEKTIITKEEGKPYQITKVEDIIVLNISNIITSLLKEKGTDEVILEQLPSFLKELNKGIYTTFSQNFNII